MEQPVTTPVYPGPATPAQVRMDPDSERGYARNPQLQEDFDAAAEHLRDTDGYVDPLDPEHRKRLRADLALEGGGVKGIGLGGAVLALDEAGYSFARVAGSSAGAIAASLVAALSHTGKPMTLLRDYLASMQFTEFMPEGKLHHFLDKIKVVNDLADVAILAVRIGLYPGTYLAQWLGPILDGLGVRRFADLQITPADDPGMSLPPDRRYRLLVHASDITREQLVRMPWDYGNYGLDAGEQEIVTAVRASMSMPFFFQPVTVQARAAAVNVALPDGSFIEQRYEAGEVSWVDGGMLRNFPISAFDRADAGPPRWPTIGVKLSAVKTLLPATQAAGSAVGVGIGCLHTLLSDWDSYAFDQTTAARTIFVDSGTIRSTQFDLPQADQDQLFLNGVLAATEFVIDMSHAGGVPRTAQQAGKLVAARRAAAGGDQPAMPRQRQPIQAPRPASS